MNLSKLSNNKHLYIIYTLLTHTNTHTHPQVNATHERIHIICICNESHSLSLTCVEWNCIHANAFLFGSGGAELCEFHEVFCFYWNSLFTENRMSCWPYCVSRRRFTFPRPELKLILFLHGFCFVSHALTTSVQPYHFSVMSACTKTHYSLGCIRFYIHRKRLCLCVVFIVMLSSLLFRFRFPFPLLLVLLPIGMCVWVCGGSVSFHPCHFLGIISIVLGFIFSANGICYAYVCWQHGMLL